MRRAGVALLFAVASSCLIPDREIEIEQAEANPGAIRILESVRFTVGADAACINAQRDAEKVQNPMGCPGAGTTQSGLIAGIGGEDLCVCPEGETDLNARTELRIEIEDPDTGREGSFPDQFFAVAFLDRDTETQDPADFVAYRNYLDPETEADEVTPNSYEPPIERGDPGRFFFEFKDGSSRVDLCNDQQGSALAPGVHVMRVMVTDRPWFRASVTDDDGKTTLLPPSPGVPDLSIGATFASTSYAFECKQPREGAEAADDGCNCGVPQ